MKNNIFARPFFAVQIFTEALERRERIFISHGAKSRLSLMDNSNWNREVTSHLREGDFILLDFSRQAFPCSTSNDYRDKPYYHIPRPVQKWANPTRRKIRGTDAFGSGHYKASRKNRSHKGADYIAEAEQGVEAVISGTVTFIGYPYKGDMTIRYIVIHSSDNLYIVRQLYVEPAKNIRVGATVVAGQIIGTAQTLQKKYPGITDHVHVEIWKKRYEEDMTPWRDPSNTNYLDPTLFIPDY